MPIAAYTFPVAAPQELIWQLISESASTPQLIDPQVEAVHILAPDEGQGILREVRRAGRTVRERVRLDASQAILVATLEDDHQATGTTTLRVEPSNPSSSGHVQPRISIRIDWQPLAATQSPAELDAISSAAEAQLLALKHAAEERMLSAHTT